MFNSTLPIGTVVMLKGVAKKLMIIGILPIRGEGENETMYDYIGVLFPEGFINRETTFLFNQDDINDIIFSGYDNPERREFIFGVEEAYNKDYLANMKSEEAYE